jgi:oligopeptide transport system substrate-binding protein
VEEPNFRTGRTHVTYSLPPERIAFYRQHEPARLRLDPFLATRFIRFNVTRAPCDNQKVRRALSLAIDRAGLVRAVLANAWRPAAHLTPPNCGGYTSRARVPTDFETARQLLAEAGFPAGRGLPGVEIQVTPSGVAQRVGEVIQETWRRELGVVSTVATTEIKVLQNNMETLNYSAGIMGFAGDFADPSTFLEVFLAKGPDNKTGWANADYDRLVAEAVRTLDSERRIELFQRAEALLLEEAPLAPLYFDTQAYLIHPAVKGWVPAPLWIRRYQNVWLEE